MQQPNDEQRRAAVTKALLRSAEHLAIPEPLLARIIGISTESVTRLRRGTSMLSGAGNEWERAVLLLRLFRSLDAIAGGSRRTALEWMQAENGALGGKRPIELITTAEGLARAVTYLDANRAIT